MSEPKTTAVSLKEFFLELLSERDRRYDQRFAAIDKSLAESVEAAKEALSTANTATDTAMTASEKAVLKAEGAADKRFEAVNEFRQQLADQQATFSRKAEVDIRFEALEKKLDVAVAQLQTSRGRETGVSAVWAALGVVAAILISAAGLVVALMRS